MNTKYLIEQNRRAREALSKQPKVSLEEMIAQAKAQLNPPDKNSNKEKPKDKI